MIQNDIDSTIPIKLENNGLERNPDGTVKSGVLNPNGRPKRKTLTELIHAKLDMADQENWDALAEIVLAKIFKNKDKEVLKTLWEYTDGKPKQTIEVEDKAEQIRKTKEYVDNKIQSLDRDIPQEPTGGAISDDSEPSENI